MSTTAHGGNLRELARACGKAEGEVVDFSANLNPLGPPEWLRAEIAAHVSALVHYPDPDCAELVAAAAQRYGVNADEVIAANGSAEILAVLPRVLGKARAVIPVPAYIDYARSAALGGMRVECHALREEDDFQLHFEALEAVLRGDEAVFLGRPNNPTGHVCDGAALREVAARHPQTVFVVDEAFGDFVDGFDSLTRERPANVAVLLSLTKAFAIPGLRLGCAVADAALARRVRELLPPWSVNTLAQAVGVAALRDADYLAQTRAFVREEREALTAELSRVPGLRVFPGEANFLLVRTAGDAPTLAARLLQEGIAIRVCTNFEGLDAHFFRLAVRTREENARLCGALMRLCGAPPVALPRRRAATLMFQGTSSNAGKSVLTAALCRILQQDGLRVAPFKSQNMSLNSFVTRDGLEMGRAQVVQAQACRIEPEARMNPILLKPNSDTGSQVIVMGKPVGNMNVGEYIRFKPRAFEAAKAAFDSLAAENDAVILEGAGSPAEVNLKRHDIVNMPMARYADAPVLLVGDIDRGGVYASFVGSLEVLNEWERARVAGFVVNRFRGQEALLRDAHEYVLRHTGVPVLGVVPYLPNLGLPEEDSVTFKAEKSRGAAEAEAEKVDIALLDLPHLSNFTDFDSLRIEPDVIVRIVRSLGELGRPDAVILPGSKHVAGDLAHLRQSGLAAAVAELAREGRTEIVGICGGYQMLGERIADPHRIESEGVPVEGLGLLELSTVMAPEKTLKRVASRHIGAGLAVHGYEIHHGRSVCGATLEPLVLREDGEVIGAGRGIVWGSYLHGIFDADPFRRWFIDRLRVRRGMAAVGQVVARYDLQEAFDRLAAIVRERLDMQHIYRLLKL